MRLRAAVLSFAVATLLIVGCVGSPAFAAQRTGHILLPAPYSFSVPRLVYQNAPAASGVTGVVLGLGTGIPHGQPFDLALVDAPVPSQLEIEFYTSLSGNGTPCDPPDPKGLDGGWDGDGGKQGTVDCDGSAARFAIVVLMYGADADVVLSW